MPEKKHCEKFKRLFLFKIFTFCCQFELHTHTFTLRDMIKSEEMKIIVRPEICTHTHLKKKVVSV